MIPLRGNAMGYMLTGDYGSPAALAFSAEGDILYSSGMEGKVIEWDLVTKSGKEMSRSPKGINTLKVSPDNNLLAGITVDGNVMIWKTATGDELASPVTNGRIVTSMGFIPWDERLVLADETGAIEIWKTSQTVKEDTFIGHDSKITFIAFNTKEKQMVTAGYDGTIKLWNVEDFRETPAIISDSDEKVLYMAFTTEGNSLITATAGSLIKRPSHVEYMTAGLCSKVTRNLSPEEWSAYVGRDIEYEKTCQDKTYHIRVNELRMSE